MSNLLFILYCIMSFVVFIGVIFLQKLLTKKRVLLGLILPLIILFNTIIIDVQIISAMYLSNFGPRVVEKYNNGLLISKSTVVTSISNLPGNILILVFFNVLTVILFIVFFAERKKIKREKELNKMRINDLE